MKDIFLRPGDLLRSRCHRTDNDTSLMLVVHISQDQKFCTYFHLTEHRMGLFDGQAEFIGYATVGEWFSQYGYEKVVET
jgi:hypothetical protein